MKLTHDDLEEGARLWKELKEVTLGIASTVSKVGADSLMYQRYQERWPIVRNAFEHWVLNHAQALLEAASLGLVFKELGDKATELSKEHTR